MLFDHGAMNKFSQRHGFEQPDAPITIRSEAPGWLRSLVVTLAEESRLPSEVLRRLLCELLLESPDPNNWSPRNIEDEVRELLSSAEWFQVFDLIEIVAERIQNSFGDAAAHLFAQKLNEAFRRKGVGWQLVQGRIEIRGEESFEASVRTAITVAQKTGRFVTERELHEALHDLSKRPNP